ncbi:hypothetical protein [Tropicimonas sp. S265A]|uniref:hypothetical protein n=1 Tax=Tropicimonas sp. S265A TaxID=3415134 RepID=UPI003C7ABF7E
MDGLLEALLLWIGDHTTYQTHDIPHPIVLQLSPEELTREYYSGVAHLMPEDGVDDRLNALYATTDGPHGTIYVIEARAVEGADAFDTPEENPLFREILLHELVHHVQHLTGAADDWACLAMGETEAYRLGGTYLRQLRVTDPLPNRNFWGAIYARC